MIRAPRPRLRQPSRLAGGALAVAALALAACGDGSDAPRRTLLLHACQLPRLPLAAQCGTLTVPENRDAPAGRTLQVAVAVLPANTLSPRPDPLFILAGGPGQAASVLGPFAAQLIGIRKDRDIVLVDQRGTGRSSPLECAAWKPDDSPGAAMAQDPVPKAVACAAELAAAGFDPAQYTTAAYVADLDAVRRALGYARINLWGGSYGTRVAQEYMRRHGAAVRSAVLDGVVPPRLAISRDAWPTRDAAQAAVLAACAASTACRAAHPDPAAALAAIAARLGADGSDIVVPDPRTGRQETQRVTFDHVLAGLQSMLYTPELQSLLPEVIARTAAGDFGPLYAIASLGAADPGAQVNSALHYSVNCAVDAARPAASAGAAALASLPTRSLAARVRAVCVAWPRGRTPADAVQPLSSDIPVLLLSGGLDPVTPPAYGDEVAKTLPRARHVVARGYGHIVSPHACGPRLVAAFVDDPDAARLPAGCVGHFEASVRPPLWPDGLGGAP